MITASTARNTARALAAAFTLCWAHLVAAQVPVPPLTGHVTDQTGTLSAEQKASIEQTLAAFEARKGSQLAVLMVASTAPEVIEQYSLRVAEQWKLGRKKVDDGAILVVAKNDRAMRIEVGYGLEGVLNDATSKRIISETITPRFKQQDFYGGITSGVGQIIGVIDGEPLPQPRVNAGDASFADLQRYAPFLLIVVLVLGRVLRSTLGPIPGATVTGGVVGVVAWFLAGTFSIAVIAGVFALLITVLGAGMGAHGMHGYYGGGGRGGFGGGGFRGGGGGFGGGGASGRW